MIKKYSYQFNIDDVVVEYPDGDIFLRERNYVKIYTEHGSNITLVDVTVAGKSIKFNYDLSKPITFDITPYYAKGATSIDISVKYDDITDTQTIPLKVNTINGYSPFLEFVPERCGDAPYARIVPPYRMLWDGKKSTTSMLAAVRDDDYFSGYEYEMEGVPYATYRPSDKWLTNAQKNEHLGETYRNTLPASGNLAKLDGNGLPMWIEPGYLSVGNSHHGKTFEEQRTASSKFCRTKTIFENYNGLTIGATPAGIQKLVLLYDANKEYVTNNPWTSDALTLNNASTFPFISIIFCKTDNTAITPSELVGITSSTLTNPEAGKSYRWVEQNGVFSWLELKEEQIVNNSFYWNVYRDGAAKYIYDDLINVSFILEKTLKALYVRIQYISPTSKKYYIVASVKRVVSLADGSLPYVYIRWKTPWGVSVEHLFYLGSYTSDKADAKELESVNYYEELSKHVRVGSFYLDGIVQPYDLFYYKTLENAELVEMYFPSYDFKPSTYMPNGDDYVAIKIKGSDVADAVVDGVTKKTITFKFELS